MIPHDRQGPSDLGIGSGSQRSVPAINWSIGMQYEGLNTFAQ
jgi:hypothetical protein